ncbi:hypothetical protein [Rummeliibacillus pycnus]|uniref:hypothetical protein n=1 Tax=Rummeliibacillus pycnus TaxID=101070 RepID=UPI0037C6643D
MKKLIQYLIALLFTLNLFSILDGASAKEKLKPSDYRLNTAYTYVYDSSSDKIKMIFRNKVGNDYHWKSYVKLEDEKKYEYVDIDTCERATSSIYGDCTIVGDKQYHTPFLKKTIKNGYTWKVKLPDDIKNTVNTQTITDTNATVKTKARTFKHVVIVKSTNKYAVSYLYFAKGHGAIKIKSKNKNEKQFHTTFELIQLTKRK